MTRSHQSRHGITLLFVISLIVLFLLMGATFVAISGNFMRVATNRATFEVRGDSARVVVDRALFDLVRGTNNPTSILNNPTVRVGGVPTQLGDQSILADQYADGFAASVLSAVSDVSSGGQLIRITLNPGPALSNIAGAYSGQVLTFISNTATAQVKGISCRIFHYDVEYDAAGAVLSQSFLIVPEWSNGLEPFDNPPDLNGANVYINGRAFTGDGTSGSTAESYDAIDAQNAFLAGVDFDNVPWVYGSFYHFSTTINGANVEYEDFRPEEFRTIPLADADGDGRPDLEVDNDGDGIKDSIWVDLGYPIQTDSSGRQYKSLAAFFVLDLDGRFNLNLHGSPNDARGRLLTDEPLLGGPTAVARGQGYGPAEISLGFLFPPPGGYPATPANYHQEYYNLLGDPSTIYYGRLGPPGPTPRYGTGEAEVQDIWSQYKLTGYPTSGVGGLFGSRVDIQGHYGWGFPPVFDFTTGTLPIGMPQADGTPPADDMVDNPYEVDMRGYPWAGPSENPLVAGGSTRDDHLFTLKELERLYRAHDTDSKFLANRLVTLSPTILGDPANRLKVATESWEVPVPPSNTVVELGTMIEAAATLAGSPPFALNQLTSLLASEVHQGLKMDINRPFGNGNDDDLNFVIDEYTSAGQGESNELAIYPTGTVTLDFSRNGQAAADNHVLARNEFARHLYVLALVKLQNAGDFNGEGSTIDMDADDRKILAQWAINVVDFRDQDSIMTPFECDENPFNGWITDGDLLTDETNDGIDNDGNGLIDAADMNEQFTERVIVWGCERPELLITETFAAHDRRTEDTPEGGTFASGDTLHFDSRLVPVASAFIELYAPWVASNDMGYPSELYAGNQLNLGQTTAIGLHPVWRIQFVRDGDAGNVHYDMSGTADARDMDPDGGFLPAANGYRYLYFTAPPAGYAAHLGAEAFYPTGGFNTLLTVGQHAVVGSSGNLPVAAGQYVSTFGRRVTAVEGNVLSFDFANTRSVTLDPAAGQVIVRDFDTLGGTMVPTTRSGVLALPIDQPRSFNLSDPPGGYLINPMDPTPLSPTLPLLNFVPVEDGLAFADAAGVPTARDEPIDYTRSGLSAAGLEHTSAVEFAALKDNHTEPSFRVMYLQRLANPLVDWHPVLNPYITVDGASTNVTAYNGVTAADDNTPTGPSDVPEDMNLDFAAMERGKAEKYPTPRDATPAGPEDRRLLWPEERRFVRVVTGTPPVMVNIDDIGNPMYLTQALGGLDQHFFSTTMFETLGDHNDAHFDVGLDANTPFTWLTWNNRPYVSHYELMLVPHRSSSQLLKSFTAKGASDPYGDLTLSDPTTNGFRHLPNFFLDEVGGGMLPLVRMRLYKLLDFVEVPSRYVGTERMFEANAAGAMPVFGLTPPFNTYSRFRVPGKVNINTVLDAALWTGVMGAYASSVPPPAGPYMGYSDMNGARRNPVSNEFIRPFRDMADASIGIDGGLLRRGAGTDSLFVFDPLSGQAAHNNSDRNAYFRFDPIQRLGNMVTTRSSVYAVWITVGYFEVDPQTGDLIDPDPADCELGSDTNDITRHRGFFIIDRSVPVAFEKGINHNVENMIMVQSYIDQ